MTKTRLGWMVQYTNYRLSAPETVTGRWWSHRWLPWLVLTACTFGALITAALLYALDDARHQAHFLSVASDRGLLLRFRTEIAFRPVQHVAAVFEAEAGAVSEQSFRALVENIPLAQAPRLAALQWHPRVIDAAGRPSLPARYSHAPGQADPPQGSDLLADPALRPWLKQVARQQHLAVSPWYWEEDEVRFRVLRPIFTTEADGQRALLGFIVGAYRVEWLLAEAWADFEPSTLEMWVSNGSGGVSGALGYIAGSVQYEAHVPRPPFATRRHTERMTLFGAEWHLLAIAGPGDFVASPWPAMIITLGGLAVGGTLARLLLELRTREQQVSALVTERTAELSRREQEFKALAEDNPDMIARLDRQLRYRYVNTASSRYTGQPGNALLGQQLGSGDDVPGTLATSLRQRAHAVLDSGEPQKQEYRLTTPSGERHFEVRLFPEADASGRVASLLLVTREITEQKLAQTTLEQLSLHDPLTGAANRRYLAQYIDREWRREARHRHPIALIMADIDHFKAYNDHYGHPAGDACLQQVAGAMQRVLQRPADTLVRYGGEEFAVVLPETDLAAARRLAERIRAAVEGQHRPHAASPVANWVTLSLGVAAVQPNEAAFAELLAAADGALYRAKAAGRNRVESADPTNPGGKAPAP